jgi:hypothetical protein
MEKLFKGTVLAVLSGVALTAVSVLVHVGANIDSDSFGFPAPYFVKFYPANDVYILWRQFTFDFLFWFILGEAVVLAIGIASFGRNRPQSITRACLRAL